MNKARFEDMMQTATFRWVLNIFLAIIIFANCEVGRLIGSKGMPFAISVVWPATGFALAALLLFGYQALVGIFLGNFCYNFFHFSLSNQFFFEPFFAAIAISFGSLLQSFMSAFIMRRFSSVLYFGTVRDIFIFLIPAGILSCMIACSIDLTTLYFYGLIPAELLFKGWLTFWVGDTLGLYILTPLLVVWATRKPQVLLSQYRVEACFMVLFFVIIGYLSLIQSYPVARLFIPFLFWVTYRFRMHGATLAIFIIVFVGIISASFSERSFVNAMVADQLINLVSFIEITVAVCLIFAAIINERDAALYLIKHDNELLYERVTGDIKRAQELRKAHKQEFQKLNSELLISQAVVKGDTKRAEELLKTHNREFKELSSELLISQDLVKGDNKRAQELLKAHKKEFEELNLELLISQDLVKDDKKRAESLLKTHKKEFEELNLELLISQAVVKGDTKRAEELLKTHNTEFEELSSELLISQDLVKGDKKRAEELLQAHKKEFEELSSELLISEKLVSIGLLTSAVVRQIQFPLKKIHVFTITSIDSFSKLQHIFSRQKEKLAPESIVEIQNEFELLKNSLNGISEHEIEARGIVKLVNKEELFEA